MSKKHIISLFFVLFLLLAGWYFYQHRSNLYLFDNIGVGDVIIIVMLSVMTFSLLGIQFNTITKIYRISLGFKEWFGLTIVNTMVSYYTPVKAGVAVRAFYLKKTHGLSYPNYTSLLATSYLINLLVASGTASFLSFLSYRGHPETYFHAFVLSVLLFAGTLGCVAFLILFTSHVTFSPRNALTKIIFDIISGFRMLRQDRIVLCKTAFIQLALIFVMALKLYWAFGAMGISVGFYNILIIQSLTNFSTVISVTPGNLGIKEGIIGSFAFVLNIPVADAVFAATIDRGISMVVTFILGIWFSRVLLSKYSTDVTIAND